MGSCASFAKINPTHCCCCCCCRTFLPQNSRLTAVGSGSERGRLSGSFIDFRVQDFKRSSAEMSKLRLTASRPGQYRSVLCQRLRMIPSSFSLRILKQREKLATKPHGFSSLRKAIFTADRLALSLCMNVFISR